jgi:hypothetical protein
VYQIDQNKPQTQEEKMKQADIRTKKINSTDLLAAENLDLVAAIDAGCIVGHYLIKKTNGYYDVYKIFTGDLY